jgi:hypothetical protein
LNIVICDEWKKFDNTKTSDATATYEYILVKNHRDFLFYDKYLDEIINGLHVANNPDIRKQIEEKK